MIMQVTILWVWMDYAYLLMRQREIPQLQDPDVVNIMDYLLDSTGNTLARTQIQKAFDEHDGKDNIIYFPPGIYKTGMLHLRGRQSLYL
jgi:polygalacturonase